MLVNAYLAFDGACAEAFRTYERVLGGTMEMMMTHGDSPVAGTTPPEHHGRIMHAQLRVGTSVLMGSDAPVGHPTAAKAGFYVSLGPPRPDEAQRIFTELAEGGAVRMPLQRTFWSPAFGMLVDRFGTPWMVNCMPAGASPA